MRYRPFGALRLLLAVMVMGQHFGWLLPGDGGYQMARFQTGDIAVLEFFILSGLIITEAAAETYAGRPIAFAMNRALRIAPPLLLAMVISIGAHAALAGSAPVLPEGYAPSGPYSGILSIKNVLANLASLVPGLGDAFRPQYRFIPYTWAIRVELQFYALLFFGLVFARWFGLRRVLTTLAVLAILGGCAYHAGLKIGALRFQPYFALGGTLYFALSGNRRAAALAIMAGGLCLYDFSQAPSVGQVRPWFVQYGLLLGTVFVMCALFRVRARGFKAWDKRLGDLSYPLYLNQYVVIIVFFAVFSPSWLTFLISVLFAFGLALATERIVEPVTTDVRDRIRGVRLSNAVVTVTNADADPLREPKPISL